MALAQVVAANPSSMDEGRVSQLEPGTWMHQQAQVIPGETTSNAPCAHHGSGTECAPCSHCTTPAAEVAEPLDRSGIGVPKHDPPQATQHYPASLFKPPRRIG